MEMMRETVMKMTLQVDIELLTAAPESNGFYGSKGMSGLVPTAYSLLEYGTWLRLTRQWYQTPRQERNAWKQSNDKQLREYSRPGWEFHAKGIW